MKTHPGSVVHLSDNPLDSNKVSNTRLLMRLVQKNLTFYFTFNIIPVVNRL